MDRIQYTQPQPQPQQPKPQAHRQYRRRWAAIIAAVILLIMALSDLISCLEPTTYPFTFSAWIQSLLLSVVVAAGVLLAIVLLTGRKGMLLFVACGVMVIGHVFCWIADILYYADGMTGTGLLGLSLGALMWLGVYATLFVAALKAENDESCGLHLACIAVMAGVAVCFWFVSEWIVFEYGWSEIGEAGTSFVEYLNVLSIGYQLLRACAAVLVGVWITSPEREAVPMTATSPVMNPSAASPYAAQPQYQAPVRPQYRPPMQHQYQPPQPSQYQAPRSPQPFSVADELIKYKKLLDDGAITQEEFETAKRRLLNM